MDELIKEWTLTAKAIRAYLEWRFKLEGGIKAIEDAAPKKETAAQPAVEPAKPKAARQTNVAKAEKAKSIKEAIAAADADLSLAVEAPRPQLSDKEALDFCYKLAADYLAKGDKAERANELRGYLDETYGKKNIAALDLNQRVEFAGYLQGKTAEAVEA